MPLPANAAANAPAIPISDTHAALLAGFRQVVAGVYALGVALLHGAASFGEELLRHPIVLVFGIIVGVACCLVAWLIALRVRHAGKQADTKTQQHGALLVPKTQNHLQTLAMPEVEKQLNSSPEGLTQEEATKRLAQYGPNELTEKKTSALLKFLKYFWGPIPWMIEVAVILSGAVRHWPDFCIILVLLFANAIIGYWEEREAGNAIDALKARLAIKARVKRDGKWVTPPAKELVPGDVIRLRLGDIVPADARLLEGDEVSVDQSALTGESLPVSKKSGDACSPGRSCGAAKSAPWFTPPARKPISARLRNWWSRPSPSAISRKRSCGSAII